MKILLHTFVICSLLTLLSCGQEEEKYVFKAPVGFTINMISPDNFLVNVGNVGVYLPRESVPAYNKLLGTVSNVKVYGMPRGANDLTGTSGVLIINTGAGTSLSLSAFELCCPHERLPDIKVIPNKDGIAKCPKCGGEFELYGGGRNKKNTSEKLQSYSIFDLGDNNYRVSYRGY